MSSEDQKKSVVIITKEFIEQAKAVALAKEEQRRRDARIARENQLNAIRISLQQNRDVIQRKVKESIETKTNCVFKLVFPVVENDYILVLIMEDALREAGLPTNLRGCVFEKIQLVDGTMMYEGRVSFESHDF